MRTTHGEAESGSRKWLQRLVATRPELIDGPVLAAIGRGARVEWASPTREDAFAEYRDGDFLDRLDLDAVRPALAQWWPRGGPQWDGLARTDVGAVLLVDAKATLRDLMTPPCRAAGAARGQIEAALTEAAAALSATPAVPWTQLFYAHAERIAHLRMLRRMRVQARLVNIYFLGDGADDGPRTEGEWRAALAMRSYAMGLPQRHALATFIHEVFVDVSDLAHSPPGGAIDKTK